MTETLSRVRDLVPQLVKRADEIERAAGLPDDVADDLTAAGCFRMLAPAAYGGDELPLPTALTVLAHLARGDASTAWAVGQVALSHLIVRCAGDAAVAEVFAGGPDALVAGAVAPRGRAAGDQDRWSVTGRWPFVTGCRRAAWFYLNCVLMSGRSVRVGPDGVPETRILLLPAADARVVDTWRVLGLRGTGSHDVAVDGAAVPGHRMIEMRDGDPASARAEFSIAQSSLIIGAVAVGIADGALSEVTGLAAGGKRPALSPRRLADDPVFHDRLGEARVSLAAARALLDTEAEAAWAVSADGFSTPLQRARLRAAATRVTALAAEVTDTAYALAGGTAVYETSPLQRRLRDMHTATQHVVAGRGSYAVLGALLVGEDDDHAPS